MAQRTMSPIDDPIPYEAPEVKPTRTRRKKSEGERLASSKQYPLIDQYMQERIKFYQRYLPTGETIVGLTKTERQNAWDNAVIIISEIEALNDRIQREVDAGKS